MLRKIFLCCVLLLALLSEATTACAEKRIALVVGNSGYENVAPGWTMPANDATLMAGTLKELGFSLVDGEAQAATKVIVFHDPSGTVPITLAPLGARPLTRAKFVLTAVSSINTSRVESSIPCSRIQRRRARATSARCRSAACRLF